MPETIDARGLSCPQPVLLLKNALANAPQSCELVCDNRTALENTTRFGEHAGYTVTAKEEKGEFTVLFAKK